MCCNLSLRSYSIYYVIGLFCTPKIFSLNGQGVVYFSVSAYRKKFMPHISENFYMINWSTLVQCSIKLGRVSATENLHLEGSLRRFHPGTTTKCLYAVTLLQTFRRNNSQPYRRSRSGPPYSFRVAKLPQPNDRAEYISIRIPRDATKEDVEEHIIKALNMECVEVLWFKRTTSKKYNSVEKQNARQLKKSLCRSALYIEMVEVPIQLAKVVTEDGQVGPVVPKNTHLETTADITPCTDDTPSAEVAHTSTEGEPSSDIAASSRENTFSQDDAETSTINTSDVLDSDEDDSAQVSRPLRATAAMSRSNWQRALLPSIDSDEDDFVSHNVYQETIIVHVQRCNIVQDMITIFKQEKITKKSIVFVFVNYRFEEELGCDVGGVSKEAYQQFWSTFLDQYGEGDTHKILSPSANLDQNDWNAIANIFFKGFKDFRFIPIKLSPAVISTCLGHGLTEEDLLEQFLKTLHPTELDLYKQFKEEKTSIEDTEELLEILSRFSCSTRPTSANITGIFKKIASSEIVQKPKFIYDCWQPILHEVRQELATWQDIKMLYEQLKPTGRKVAKKIVAGEDEGNDLKSSEATALGYLHRYVKSLEPHMLCKFLNFTTGCSNMPIDDIKLNFNVRQGLTRLPVAHTCGQVLELSIMYNSYPDLKQEFDLILNSPSAMEFTIA